MPESAVATMDIALFLKKTSEALETILREKVPVRNVPQKPLFEAARYALLGPGKRIRPILALAVVDALGASTKEALEPVCALEMVHASSLIHDDLPCMDDDDYRRGRPTLHKVYREGEAVLTGWYLVARAFEIICESTSLSEKQRMELCYSLAKSSGGDGLAAGQWLDLENEGKPADLERLRYIHTHKTGAIIESSIEFGAIIGNASSEQKEALIAFGRDIGLAFQVVDDILDVTQSVKKHGHAVASDVTKDKATYVSLLGLDGAKAEAKKLYTGALKRLHSIPGIQTEKLESLARLIVEREG